MLAAQYDRTTADTVNEATARVSFKVQGPLPTVIALCLSLMLAVAPAARAARYF